MQVGIDIQETETLERFIGTQKMQRLFSKRELEYIDQKNNALQTIAGLYCAKEAFFKALGKGLVISQLTEVEILHNHSGAPYYQLSRNVITQNGLGTAKITLSISHTKTVAVAICIIIKTDLLLG